MLLDNIGGGLAPGRHREADDAVLGLDLNDQGAQHIDAEAAATLTVFGIFRHWRGDMVVDPVAIALVMIVGAAACAVILHDEGANVLDLWKAAH